MVLPINSNSAGRDFTPAWVAEVFGPPQTASSERSETPADLPPMAPLVRDAAPHSVSLAPPSRQRRWDIRSPLFEQCATNPARAWDSLGYGYGFPQFGARPSFKRGSHCAPSPPLLPRLLLNQSPWGFSPEIWNAIHPRVRAMLLQDGEPERSNRWELDLITFTLSVVFGSPEEALAYLLPTEVDPEHRRRVCGLRIDPEPFDVTTWKRFLAAVGYTPSAMGLLPQISRLDSFIRGESPVIAKARKTADPTVIASFLDTVCGAGSAKQKLSVARSRFPISVCAFEASAEYRSDEDAPGEMEALCAFLAQPQGLLYSDGTPAMDIATLGRWASASVYAKACGAADGVVPKWREFVTTCIEKGLDEERICDVVRWAKDESLENHRPSLTPPHPSWTAKVWSAMLPRLMAGLGAEDPHGSDCEQRALARQGAHAAAVMFTTVEEALKYVSLFKSKGHPRPMHRACQVRASTEPFNLPRWRAYLASCRRTESAMGVLRHAPRIDVFLDGEHELIRSARKEGGGKVVETSIN